MDFLDQKNQKLKQDFVNHLLERSNQIDTNLTVSNKFKTIIEEINELSNIKLITINKTDKDILDLLKYRVFIKC